MARYVCVNCGLKAISKCVQRRNIFTDMCDHSGMFTLLENIVCLRDGKLGVREDFLDLLFEDKRKAELSSKVLYFTTEELEARSKVWRKLSSHEREMLMCMHQWQIVEGECIAGCCKVGETIEEKR